MNLSEELKSQESIKHIETANTQDEKRVQEQSNDTSGRERGLGSETAGEEG